MLSRTTASLVFQLLKWGRPCRVIHPYPWQYMLLTARRVPLPAGVLVDQAVLGLQPGGQALLLLAK